MRTALAFAFKIVCRPETPRSPVPGLLSILGRGEASTERGRLARFKARSLPPARLRPATIHRTRSDKLAENRGSAPTLPYVARPPFPCRRNHHGARSCAYPPRSGRDGR